MKDLIVSVHSRECAGYGLNPVLDNELKRILSKKVTMQFEKICMELSRNGFKAKYEPEKARIKKHLERAPWFKETQAGWIYVGKRDPSNLSEAFISMKGTEKFE